MASRASLSCMYSLNYTKDGSTVWQDNLWRFKRMSNSTKEVKNSIIYTGHYQLKISGKDHIKKVLKFLGTDYKEKRKIQYAKSYLNNAKQNLRRYKLFHSTDLNQNHVKQLRNS